MKPNVLHFQRTLLACLALVCVAGSAQSATTIVFDTHKQAPSTGPQTPPWILATPGIYLNGSDSTNSSGNLFKIVDGNENNDPSYYYTNSVGMTATDVSPTMEWELRMRLRVMNSGSLSTEKGTFYGWVVDGSRLIGIGVEKQGGNTNRFFFIDSVGSPIDTGGGPRFDDVVPSGDDFFNVRMTKEGTTGGFPDTVRLYVNGVQVENELLIAFPAVASREILFGSASSPAFGTTEMTGFSFGSGSINAAPLLVPEPSVVALAAMGVLAAIRFRRSR